tara:strand:+ start:866 stop:1720 length:855 start_codon:yes stop_codon:yes gene_type:complete
MAELRKYGVATTIYFPLIEGGQTNYLQTAPTFVAADVDISKDGSSFGTTSNLPSHLGNGVYKLDLTATEITGKIILVTVVDNTATQVWEDQTIIVETYGNVNAMHPFDLGSTAPDVNIAQINTDITAAVNLEADYDGSGFNKSNSTIGKVGDKTGFEIAGNKTKLDDLNDVSTTEIANAVWDAQRDAHKQQGTFGEFVNIDEIKLDKIDAQTTQLVFKDGDVVATLDGESVAPTKEEIASAIREELKTELARIDKPISDCCSDVEREQSTGNKPFTPDIQTGVE